MKHLYRTKKKEMQGFQELVKKLEVTPKEKMMNKFFLYSLEDPVYMSWIAKNMLSVEKFLQLSTDEIDLILKGTKDQGIILQRAFHKTPYETKLLSLLSPSTHEFYKQNIDLVSNLTKEEKEEALFVLFKTFRHLQNKDAILSLPWRLPTIEVLKGAPKNLEPNCKYEQFFDDSTIVALKGELKRSKREGVWDHYFTTGQLMARGQYHEDEMDGHWCFYFSDGRKKSEGFYSKGKKTGIWKEWDKSGQDKDLDYGQIKEESEEDQEES